MPRVMVLYSRLACTYQIAHLLPTVFSYTKITPSFSRLYGLTGGGFVSLLPTLTADLVGIRNLSRGLGMCYLSAIFGTLFGTPLAGILSDRAGYAACIEFAGATTIASSLILIVLRQRRSKGVIFCKI